MFVKIPLAFCSLLLTDRFDRCFGVACVDGYSIGQYDYILKATTVENLAICLVSVQMKEVEIVEAEAEVDAGVEEEVTSVATTVRWKTLVLRQNH